MDTLDFQSTGRRWRADLSRCFDLAITLEFDGPQPRSFADGPAHGAPLRAGAFTGRVADGARFNCNVHTLAPHCHGTHTECVGHMTADPVTLTRVTPVAPCLAALVTVQPERLANCAGPTGPASAPDDQLVTRRALERAAAQWLASPWTALVVVLPSLDHADDGLYLLDLQVPAFAADAAPSRPVIYPVTEQSQ